MGVYVIWKFAENIDGAKKFLVDYIGNFHDAFVNSQFYDFPTFQRTVPDIKKLLAKDPNGKPAGKYSVLKTSLNWATNIGYPGYANAAIDEVYQKWVINVMFAKAAQGVLSPEDAVKEAEAECRRIWDKWRERSSFSSPSLRAHIRATLTARKETSKFGVSFFCSHGY